MSSPPRLCSRSNGRTQVLVLFGGRSAEHEISILSARFVASALDPGRFEPLLVGIGRDGRWYLQDRGRFDAAHGDAREAMIDDGGLEVFLPPVPARADDRAAALLFGADGSRRRVDVVFPVLHGPMGEDGCTQGLLELAKVPYVGAGVLGSALGMDKEVQRRLLDAADIPVLPFELVRGHEWTQGSSERRRAIVARCEALGLPVFAKPVNMGSSLGVRRATNVADLEAAIAHALEFDTKVIVERGLDHPREIECAVLGTDEPIVSVPGEIAVRHADGFYSFDAKYLDDGADLLVPAALGPAEAAAAQLLAVRTYRLLEGAGLARVDMFLASDGRLYLNEVNTMPGFTAISMYPRLWAASGIDARTLVSRLIDLGLERHAARAALRVAGGVGR